MSGQFLNRSGRRTAHRQERTERVPKNVDPAMLQLRCPSRRCYVVSDDVRAQSFAFPVTEHERSSLHADLPCGDRKALRRAIAEKWSEEDAYTNYRYNVERCANGKRVHLLGVRIKS
jgi:hypothetical protein